MKWITHTKGLSTAVSGTLDSPRKLRDIPDMREIISGMRPLRWLAHLPLAVLPFLAALVIQVPPASAWLARTVEQRLAAAGQGWAKVEVSGRDVEIRGIAPDRAAADAAYRIVIESFGVRHAVLRVRVGV